MHHMRLSAIAVTALCLIAISGCSRGPARGNVSGTVTLDGKPLPGVIVVFHPHEHEAPLARGTSTETGGFVLAADDGGNGVVVGPYRVVVLDPQALAAGLGARPGQSSDTPSRVPPRYQSWQQTSLEIEVMSESADVEVPLTTIEE